MLERLIVNSDTLRERVQRDPNLPLARVNFLCGPNGSGKSTVISGLRELVLGRGPRDKGWTSETAPVLVDGQCRAVCFFDAEQDNVRKADLNGVFDGVRLSRYFDAKEMSHGQSNYEELAAILRGEAFDVVVLDEPEAALDVDGVLWLRHEIARSEKQFLIATHNPILLQMAVAGGATAQVFGKDERYVERLVGSYAAVLTGKMVPKPKSRNLPRTSAASRQARSRTATKRP